jgi:hypothetical protein
VLTVFWQAETPPGKDYAVAAHLVSHDPPRESGDIVAQADQRHPVHGWYPTSRWRAGEIVRDHYQIEVPGEAQLQAIRLALYQRDASGNFVNSPWLSLPYEK